MGFMSPRIVYVNSCFHPSPAAAFTSVIGAVTPGGFGRSPASSIRRFGSQLPATRLRSAASDPSEHICMCVRRLVAIPSDVSTLERQKGGAARAAPSDDQATALRPAALLGPS